MPGPPLSPTHPSYRPICILLSGNVGIGKSTLSNQLQSEGVELIQLDSLITEHRDTDDKVLRKFYDRFANVHERISIFSELVNRDIPVYYAEFLYKNIFGKPDLKPVIIMEGYTLTRGNIVRSLLALLKKNGIHVWDLNKRVL